MGLWLAVVPAIFPGRVHAQAEPLPCEPLTAASLEAVAERLALGEDQVAWLRARFRRGRLRGPEDLEGLPGVGAELRDRLEAAWCWEDPRQGRGEWAVRSRRDGIRGELRVTGSASGIRLEGRWRAERGCPPRERVAVTARGGGWSVVGGTLRARHALGLLLVTPGAEPRGNAPARWSERGWTPSLAWDPETMHGIAVAREGGRWRVEGAWVRAETSPGEARAAGETASVRWRRGTGTFGVLVGEWGGSRLASVTAQGAAGSRRWSVEWAWGAEGSAQGISWAAGEGRWRFRSSLVRRGARFHVPQVRLVRVSPGETEGALRVEGRWQREAGRFLRVALAEERRGKRGAASWTSVESVRELEVGQRLSRSLRGLLLWRTRARGPDGAPEDPALRQRVLRGQLLYRRRRWQLDLRLEERATAAGRSRLTAFRLGRDAGPSWRMEIGLARRTGGAPPDLWWYRRRAGGLYGWDRLRSGAWIGAWGRLPGRGWTLEGSAANRPDGWEAAVSLQMQWTNRTPAAPQGVDPAPRRP